MKSEKVLAARIDAAKRAIAALGDMRPGHLSVQQRASGKNRRGYAQLSYTFQKRSRTDYVQPEDVERVRSEIANYRKFKELCERLGTPQGAACHRPGILARFTDPTRKWSAVNYADAPDNFPFG